MQHKIVCGFIDRIDASGVRGWAGDLTTPDPPLVIQLTVDDVVVDSLTCGMVRSDVAEAGFPTESVGFYARLPEWCLDGVEHTLGFLGADGVPLSRADFVEKDGALVQVEHGPWSTTFTLTAPPVEVKAPASKRDFLRGLFQREALAQAESEEARAPEARAGADGQAAV